MNGTTNIGSICKVYNMTTASASRNTKKLEVTHGFIEQRPDPWDARTTLNSLSAKGAALYDRLVEILEG
jgi:DNA-binding MarR family transcriptional regulator